MLLHLPCVLMCTTSTCNVMYSASQKVTPCSFLHCYSHAWQGNGGGFGEQSKNHCVSLSLSLSLSLSNCLNGLSVETPAVTGGWICVRVVPVVYFIHLSQSSGYLIFSLCPSGPHFKPNKWNMCPTTANARRHSERNSLNSKTIQ